MEGGYPARALAGLERLADRYAIDRRLGAGGMAEVYLATDVRHDRRVAVKVMRPELAKAIGSQRFLREISIAAKLAHPNIVPLYDSDHDGSLLFYVMPYVQGPSLRERITKERQLPIDEALLIALEIADALAYAHGCGIVHRDIKPENVLLESGHALVTDFGIARAIEAAADERLTSGRIVLGTPAYMSPEQASASGVLDGRSDLYSLALVLYEMLGGDVPFHASTPDGLLARKGAGQYPPLRVIRRTVPERVDRAIARALQPVPADRFLSVREFADALRTPAVLPVQNQLWQRPWVLLPLAAVAVLGGVVAITMSRRPALPPAVGLGRIVVSPLENRTGNSSLDVVGVMAGDWMTEGLQKTGVVDVVPALTAIEASRFVGSGGAGDRREPMRALAHETGAGTIVSGSFYRRGDRLLFRVAVADQSGTRLVQTLADVEGPVSEPLPAIQELRTRLMGWLAVHYDDRVIALGSEGDRPPTYDAYRAFSEGMTRYIAVENRQAFPLFLQAFKLDTSFTVALLYASISLTNLGEWARADSLLGLVSLRRGSLSEYHQAWLDYRLAFIRGNREAALAAIRTAARLAPESKAAYNHAVEAFLSGHVREALSAIEALPTDRGPMRGFSPYWDIYGAILHTVGAYDREYGVALTARRAYPDRLTRFTPLVRALAARGRLPALASAMRDAEGVPTDPVGWDYGHLLAEVADELRAHGHADVSVRYLEQLRGWLETNEQAPRSKWRLVRTLYALGRWDEAGLQLGSLRLLDPGNVDYLGMTGLLHSRRGDVQAAMLVADSLATRRWPYDRGAAGLYRARIAAVLGDSAAAVARLREALASGAAYDLWLHRDVDFYALRAYAPFVELRRGKE